MKKSVVMFKTKPKSQLCESVKHTNFVFNFENNYFRQGSAAYVTCTYILCAIKHVLLFILCLGILFGEMMMLVKWMGTVSGPFHKELMRH